MQKPFDKDIIVFSNGDAGQVADFSEKDFDGRRGTHKCLPLNSPAWCQKAVELGLIDKSELCTVENLPPTI